MTNYIDILKTEFDERELAQIEAVFSHTRPTTLRANTIKSSAKEIAEELTRAGIEFEKVDWYGDAFALRERRDLRELDIYKDGKIYLQSLSSMMPPLELDPHPGEDILDMCAAPGGKTTQLAALGGRGCNITAVEMHAPRAERLRYNLAKQGASNVVVMQTDARRLDEFFRFDKILLDAPCSGSGTLNLENEKQMKGFTQALIDKCCKQQAALLKKALELLKPGGTLIYSTCSILKCENENQIEKALSKASPDFELKSMKTIYPDELYEGFFIAKITH